MNATCPVASSLVRYQAEYDRKQAYLDEIARRTDDLIESGDLDCIKDEMSMAELDSFATNLRTFCRCSLEPSRKQASDEVRQILKAAARRVAEAQYKKEMDDASEQIAVENYYRRMEMCQS